MTGIEEMHEQIQENLEKRKLQAFPIGGQAAAGNQASSVTGAAMATGAMRNTNTMIYKLDPKAYPYDDSQGNAGQLGPGLQTGIIKKPQTSGNKNPRLYASKGTQDSRQGQLRGKGDPKKVGKALG